MAGNTSDSGASVVGASAAAALRVRRDTPTAHPDRARPARRPPRPHDIPDRRRARRRRAHSLDEQPASTSWAGDCGTWACWLPCRPGCARAPSPFLNDIHAATLATVHLAIRDGLQVLYLERLSGRASVPVVSTVGSRLPLHATGVGKVLLAHAPAEVQEQVLADLHPITPVHRDPAGAAQCPAGPGPPGGLCDHGRGDDAGRLLDRGARSRTKDAAGHGPAGGRGHRRRGAVTATGPDPAARRPAGRSPGHRPHVADLIAGHDRPQPATHHRRATSNQPGDEHCVTCLPNPTPRLSDCAGW